jgi:hypothetical protein
MRYYLFQQDMSIQDQWFLSDPFLEDGTSLMGWNFTIGKRYIPETHLHCEIRQQGAELPISFGGLNVPYLRDDIVKQIEQPDVTGYAYDLIPIFVTQSERKYFILNVLNVADAIDRRSEVEYYSLDEIAQDRSRADRYKSIWNLVLSRQSIAPSWEIFRLKRALGRIVVNERIRLCIENYNPHSGAKFTAINCV